MEIMKTEVTPSFPQNMEMRTWSLNPEAPEFFPARSVIVSAPNCSIFSPTNPPFFHYPTLSCLHPHALPAPLFSHPSHPYYPHQHAVQAHFLTPEKIAAAAAYVPVTESVSSLLEPFKAKMVLNEEQDRRIVVRKEKMGGTRRRNKGKHYWRNKSYGKEDFVRVDSTQARKKAWTAKPSSYSTGDNKHFARNADQASFEYPKKVQGRAGSNNKEKHPPIPLKNDGNETTVMIRNIPNRYTREMLKDFLDQHCMIMNKGEEFQNAGADEPSFSAFDFLYLPIDFVTESNKGYAFVNFTNPGAARKFFDVWHDKHWDCFLSNKIREIYCAKLQGMEQLVKHFERMEFPSEDFQPKSFSPARDGTKQLVKETVIGRCTGSKCI